MKIYVAGPYQWKDDIAFRASHLRAAGIEVTSRWLLEKHAGNIQLSQLPEDVNTTYAKQDLDDIDAADAFLLFAVPSEAPPIPRAGRHVEFGYALARGKKMLVVGDVKENIFHYLPQVRHFQNFEDAMRYFIDHLPEVTGR